MRALLLGLALLLRAFAARVVDLAERGVGALGFAPGQPVRWVGGPWARTMTGVVYEDPEHGGLRVARAVARCEQAGINAEMAARRERVAVTERWIRECSPAICAGGFLGMTVRENLHENPDIDPNDQRIIHLRAKYPLPAKATP